MHFLSGETLFEMVSSDMHSFSITRDPNFGNFDVGKPTEPGSVDEDLLDIRAYRRLRQINFEKILVAADVQAPISPIGSNFGDSLYPNGLIASPEAFHMLGLNLIVGRTWTQAEDDNHSRVVVISASLAEQLYGETNALNKTLAIGSKPFVVIGVAKDWKILPHFYNTQAWTYSSKKEDYLIPIQSASDLGLMILGSSCVSSSDDCRYLSLWTNCKSTDCTERANKLNNYLHSLPQDGRSISTPISLTQWLLRKRLVPSIATVGLGGSILFFAICVLSAAGTLLAKFRNLGVEVGIHRSLGAPASSIFSQCILEAFLYALIASLCGWVMSRAGLWLFRSQPTDYAAFVSFNSSQYMFLSVILILVTFCMGVAPAWLAARTSPAELLRSSR